MARSKTGVNSAVRCSAPVIKNLTVAAGAIALHRRDNSYRCDFMLLARYCPGAASSAIQVRLGIRFYVKLDCKSLLAQALNDSPMQRMRKFNPDSAAVHPAHLA